MPSEAEDNAEAQKDWQFQLAPFYLWTWTVSGDMTVRDTTADVDVDLTDLVDNLQGALVANFQGFYKNKWGFLFDYNYARFAENTYQGPLYLDVNMTMQLLEFDGLYRLSPKADHFLDIKAGMRYIGLDPTVKIYAPRRYNKVDNKQDWVDPVVGLRWIWQFADQLQLALLGDIGGFGVGSEFTWQGAATIDWKPFQHVSFRGGYRAIYADYEDGSRYSPDYFHYDATIHGPMLGVVFQW